MLDMAYLGFRMKEILGLSTEPVAIFLLKAGSETGPFKGWESGERLRYCQALMKARRGKKIWLGKDDIACPAAAAAFGFKELPKGLTTGAGLVGFGIVEAAETGSAMFAGMPRLEPGRLESVALCPLKDAPAAPDVVVVEGPPESLMWLALADLNLEGGARRRADTAVLQATCVDATVVPFLEKRLNFSLGCYGCREATDIEPGETVLGFPGEKTEPLYRVLELLRKKAMPNSRDKAAFRHLGECAP